MDSHSSHDSEAKVCYISESICKVVLTSNSTAARRTSNGKYIARKKDVPHCEVKEFE
jgi:hypothetical protein